jgi:ribosomal protein L10
MVEIHKKPEFEKCTAKGGVMDGERLTPEKVVEVSKWPNRVGQISLLLGQILSPGASLLSQVTGPGGRLLSQIEKKGKGEEDASSPANP